MTLATPAAVTRMLAGSRDDKNPLADHVNHEDLILGLVYKEAKALSQLEAAPLPEKK
jgi:hypothetical protein